MMLKENTISHLRGEKNLLAFSGGVDSTALFFLLHDAKVDFDIVIVDYGLRLQSKEEVSYAKELANKYNCQLHIHQAPKITTNFEAQARKIRYDFFNILIKQHSYKNLLTAHHLGDRLEWMLMQFVKGAGCAELSSMKSIEKHNTFNLVRPLLEVDKQELQTYLDAKNIKYFIDESNANQDIKRNYFRHTYSEPLLQKYKDGIKKSFQYIDDDATALIQEVQIHKIQDFAYFKSHNKRSDIYTIDKYLKSCNLMISAKERDLLKIHNVLIVGRKYILNWHLDFVFIAPYDAKSVTMSHNFKEKMRLLKIEPKLRPYFFTSLDVFESLEGTVPLQ